MSKDKILFSDTLEALKKDKHVTRGSGICKEKNLKFGGVFDDDKLIGFKVINAVGGESVYSFSTEDIISDDWIIL